MLVFIDESGDTGLKIKEGSSSYFIVSLVIFEDDDEATNCDKRIQLLKRELGKSEDFEFHFYHNSEKLRQGFLKAVAPYSFSYLCFALNKKSKNFYGEGFKYRDSFYKCVCGFVFENAKPYLKEAKVKIDKSGAESFRGQLANYLKKKLNSKGYNLIKKIKMEHSHSNNLLQLADYVSGIINRKIKKKKDFELYYKYIASKEIDVRSWPK